MINRLYKILFLSMQIGVCCLLSAGCADENRPDNLAPEVTLNEATGITRTGALLTGTVSIPAGSRTNLFRFLYGTSPQPEHALPVSPGKDGALSANLSGLTPGTDYYYRLEAGNAGYLVQSEVRTFTTQPNRKPSLQPVRFLGQGPVSIILQCDIADDGGEEVTARGFRCESSGGDVREETVPLNDASAWRLRIGELSRNTDYTVRAFAENRIGRAYGEPYSFGTADAVVLAEAGTLPEIIGEEKYGYTRLNIVGKLNGTDLRLLRDMGGRDIYGNETAGRLAHWNLTDAAIVEGGLTYDESRHTEADVAGYGMFAGLTHLCSVELPAKLHTVAKDAFGGCTSLASLRIPSGVTSLMPSSGCTGLQTVTVSDGNPCYMSLEGIVYSKNGESLVWFPEGTTTEELRLSPALKHLEAFALQQCRARTVVLPASLTDIGQQAFRRAEIETIAIPDGVAAIPYALFQECGKLAEITLGSGCRWLSDYCFDGCPLKDIHVQAVVPPACSTDTFTGAEHLFSSCTLHVPSGSKALYRNHPVWKQFEYIEESGSGNEN